MDRYTIVSRNIFRSTGGRVGSIQARYETIEFQENVLEDTLYFFTRCSPNSRIGQNIVRRLSAPDDASGAISQVGDFYGGGEAWGDVVPEWKSLMGQSAYPRATTNITGGNLELAGGIGRRLFTAISNTAGAVAVTVATKGLGFYLQGIPVVDGSQTFTSGTDFTLGSDNTAPQLAITATNLAAAIKIGRAHV